MRTSIPFFATIIAFSFFISCGNTADKTSNSKENQVNKDTLMYRFGDASLPPEYHRSYTINVTPGMVFLSIEVYGDILASDSAALSTDSYKAFAKSISDLQIKNKVANENEGCVGGTSDTFDLYPGTSKQVSGHIYHCGGAHYGDLDGDVSKAAGLFNALIPDLQNKIDATKRE
jgi:hypothetical protein